MSTMTMAQLHRDASNTHDWKQFNPTSLKIIRNMLLAKHGSLTAARVSLGFNNASALSDILANRSNHPAYVEIIQRDLQLSDEQVLKLWPLLREWPRESRRVS